ncbi:MAG: LexA family transcriptional regulator [Paraburkholderia sp.]|uniref:XRE family transcriptional regulator n=1 Tax=Paraburkholderia sp. TaxID=1926495 RepID=UPI0011FFD2DB|nr:LexA family transcriptional regulator [Paraburkholderia sp.]TAM07262.1 MAG: LexA family transcriptional regulator [Paraburkholderia sp.]TAM32634.1 MAG: LexA family transcriptional regulator [Paraburkholderia sp.]
MNLAERLDFAMKARRVESQSALSRASGVPQPTINRILKGTTTKPDTDTLQKLADALEVSLAWLVDETGDGPHAPKSSGKRLLPKDKGNVVVWDNPADLEPDEERIWIDRFDYHFSAGNGLIQWEVREKKALPFNAAFFKAKGARPQDCKLLILRGDSMEPWAEDKNMIMIDVTSTRILDGERYAIYFEDEPLVKQIFKEVGGSLRLHSYNQKYPDKLVAPDKLEFVHIVGRVIYRSG